MLSPKEIEKLEANKDISNYQIETDIKDTEIEIAQLLREIESLEVLQHPDKMASLRLSGKRYGVGKRRVFSDQLKELLQLRKEYGDELRLDSVGSVAGVEENKEKTISDEKATK